MGIEIKTVSSLDDVLYSLEGRHVKLYTDSYMLVGVLKNYMNLVVIEMRALGPCPESATLDFELERTVVPKHKVVGVRFTDALRHRNNEDQGQSQAGC